MATTYTSDLTDAIREVYSREILFASQPVLRFEEFCVQRTELGKEAGDTINILKYDNLTLGGALTETKAIDPQKLSASQVQITVTEYGNAVSVSEKLLRTSFDDIMTSAARLLGHDYAKVLDILLRDTLLALTAVVYPAGRTARNQILAADILKTSQIKDAVEVLSTANAPKIAGDFYICFIHPHQGRGLRDDNSWINASQYAGSTQIFNGEIGRYEDVRFIETTQMPILSAAGGGTPKANVYQSLMIGEDAYGLAFGLPPELRDNGIEDFGRKHAIAWYCIMGAGALVEDRVIRLETA